MNLPSLSTLDQGLLAGAEALHHSAQVLRNAWTAFWQRDPAVVIAELNGDIVKHGTAFALNEQAATAINALLDAVNDERFPTRAPVAMPEYWAFDGTQFTYTSPAPEEPTPEPEP